MNSMFSISVKNIRAIKQAEIDLNGITVLSGENGCGKTTISKLLYSFIKTSVNINSVISNLYFKTISFSYSLLKDLVSNNDSTVLNQINIDFPEINEEFLDTTILTNSEKFLAEILLPKLRIVKQKYENHEYSISDMEFERLFKLYEKHIHVVSKKEIVFFLQDFEEYIVQLIKEISNAKVSHNLNIFTYKFDRYFNESTENWNYSFKEFNSDLIDKKSNTVILQKSFSDAIYIDVPTVFDNDFYRTSDKESLLADLRNSLNINNTKVINKELSNIMTDVLNGQISRKEDMFSRIFIYTARNGKSIPLSHAASGLKCFAVLERLFSNGCLDENTLLIVDEPEVHLHPKWIVEYARVLVLIQKYLHTTILIASHNPDMVSAIKYISEKEKCSDALTFYLAKEISLEDFGKYEFKNLGTDIEEIFASFNVALDRINKYGAFDEE